MFGVPNIFCVFWVPKVFCAPNVFWVPKVLCAFWVPKGLKEGAESAKVVEGCVVGVLAEPNAGAVVELPKGPDEGFETPNTLEREAEPPKVFEVVVEVFVVGAED